MENVQSMPPNTKPSVPKLEKLTSTDDIDACLKPELSRSEVVERLEYQWFAISSNIDSVISYLEESSKEVSLCSIECLKKLENAVNKTCDDLDDEMKSFYHMITKCEDLNTKLSAASAFREEIKTLRKSVDTLESLFKTRPQSNL